ncbi:Nuclear cap-binding protein subunit 1, partial [Blyttiomyces sp. JEL0837]
LHAAEWNDDMILRLNEGMQQELAGSIAHPVSKIPIPSDFGNATIPEQEPLFWAFDDSVNSGETKLVNLPPTSSIQRFIMDDLVVDTIHMLSHNHFECCNILLHMPNFHINAGGYNFCQAIVENLIRELIKLPASQEKSVYYATLLFDLCKEARDEVPRAMGRSLRTIFSRLDSEKFVGGGMDVECIRRLGEWMAHHLSNFDFKWKWIEWGSALEKENSAQFCFIRETLEREIRLSYYDRVKGTIPDTFQNHGRVFPLEAPAGDFTYGDSFNSDDEAFSELVSRLHTLMLARGDISVVKATLEAIHKHRQQKFSSDFMSMDGVPKRPADKMLADEGTRDIFVQNVMFLGSKSFSHMLNVLERFVKILHEFNLSEEDRLNTVSIVATYWRKNPQVLEITLDKLCNYRVIDPLSIITWALSDEVVDSIADRWYLWTILRNALKKVNGKVEQLRQKQAASVQESAMAVDDANGHEVDDLQGHLDTALRDQKRFSEKLGSMIDAGIEPSASAQWRWIAGNMREMGRAFRKEIKTVQYTVDAMAFSHMTKPQVQAIWDEIKAVSDMMI